MISSKPVSGRLPDCRAIRELGHRLEDHMVHNGRDAHVAVHSCFCPRPSLSTRRRTQLSCFQAATKRREIMDVSRVKAGDVVFHEQFEAHLDRFSETGAGVLDLRLPIGCSYTPGAARGGRPRLRCAPGREKPRETPSTCFFPLLSAEMPRLADWPDELAAALIEESISQTISMGRTGRNSAVDRVAGFRFGVWCFTRGVPCPHSRPPCFEV